MLRFLMVICAALTLAGCSGKDVWAPDEAVNRSIYRHGGQPTLTLYTMLNNRTGNGAHTSLLINGSHRIIFDPAGSFAHETVPERNDVLFGATPEVVDVYTRYHARETYHVRIQELTVSPQLAQQAMTLAQQYGSVPAAQCSYSTSAILEQLFPGRIKQTWYPKQLSEQFATLGKVRTQVLHEYDSDDNSKVLAEWKPKKKN